MSKRILAISHAIILFHTTKILSQSTPPTSTLPSFTSSAPPPTSTAQQKTDSKIEVFWHANWHWFLIGFLSALVPILMWAILGPGRRWYRRRKNKSAPIQWDRVGSERFQSPSMRQIGGFQKSRGSGSSTTSSRLALSLNAAAPGEQDIETAAAIASPKSPSTYIRRERMIRNDSSEAVIGLVQPQIHSPRLPAQGLMPPNRPADRNSTGSLGPPDPHVHRAHPKYNTFQRYSRQHKKRSLSMPVGQQNIQPQSSDIDIRQESMNLLQTQISHRVPQPAYQQRSFVPTAANMRTSQQIFLPQPPKSTPYHIRQGSHPHDHERTASWHHTIHRGSTQTNPYGLQIRHTSMDGYHPISEPMMIPSVPSPTTETTPHRSLSRGRLQKPQYMNPRSNGYHIHQRQPEPPKTREEPRMSFYRTPQASRESLGRPRASSNPSSIPEVPSLPQQPTYPKIAYPARSAMSSKSYQHQDRVYGTESSYSYSISAGNPPAKSVKFAALPQLSSSAPARLPIHHF
ncbi:hypothetical protein TWF225_004031 [Orbilia oligospora]|uniref:Uncharacterized protein n=1 Tax=Orbilia oligospora TaxID=2813651 RepID=A0A8H2E555_ORBOL|nr:hypothetical protein TWF225_004031 [Orbilia oligospora]KAF3248065.1 hypothetical protein TWF128_008440 [Orbilia oligospora]KAF3248066.1 hypothetical protein TWF128_008440 [Orbilia oligospora]KAF3256172.1 hypothetical protein TWF217_006423 [Orbilia oligospora]KAF3284525.1 hypothetical protein TWF132_009690 [Orbilia oligospora]